MLMITAIFLQRWKQLSRLQRNIITVVLGVTIFVAIYFISKQPSNVSQAYHGVIFSYICGTGLDWTFGGPVFNMLKISCFVVVSVCFCLIISFACIWVNMLWVQEDGDMYNYLDVCCVCVCVFFFFCNACATYCCFYVFLMDINFLSFAATGAAKRFGLSAFFLPRRGAVLLNRLGIVLSWCLSALVDRGVLFAERPPGSHPRERGGRRAPGACAGRGPGGRPARPQRPREYSGAAPPVRCERSDRRWRGQAGDGSGQVSGIASQSVGSRWRDRSLGRCVCCPSHLAGILGIFRRCCILWRNIGLPWQWDCCLLLPLNRPAHAVSTFIRTNQ